MRDKETGQERKIDLKEVDSEAEQTAQEVLEKFEKKREYAGVSGLLITIISISYGILQNRFLPKIGVCYCRQL